MVSPSRTAPQTATTDTASIVFQDFRTVVIILESGVFFFFNSMVDNLEILRCCVFVVVVFVFYHFGRDESD